MNNMSDRQEIFEKLKALKPELEAHYKVKRIALFGSCVRGEAHEGSDIDVLVDFVEGASLFDLVHVKQFLEEKLGRPVDVVPRESLHEDLREGVSREMVEV